LSEHCRYELNEQVEPAEIAIVVPCHRVIGSNGEVKGYASGLYRAR
jgi:O6-methylguanine-DNA--protein-cysteine methyltransferase